jgi:CRISPR-associated endonuclease Csn1
MTKVLGIDLGTSSIGWSLINEENKIPTSIIDMGVRIFPEVTDAKTKTPKNQERRLKRGLRRQTNRKSRRRKKVASVLKRFGLLSCTQNNHQEWRDWNFKMGCPYEIRKKALVEKISKEEFAKVMVHFSKRRGFKSNRKVAGGEDGVVKSAISEIRQKMESSGFKTVGEFLFNQEIKRGKYLHRDMFEDEFNQIWAKQSSYDSLTYNDKLKEEIWDSIFFQRPLKIQKHLIGNCSLEQNRKRCPKAYLAFQEFRILSELSNLEIKDPITGDHEPLSSDQKERIFQLLNYTEKLTWKKVRKELGLHDGETINLEETGVKHLQGNKTAHQLIKIIGKEFWSSLSQAQKEQLITDLATIELEKSLENRLTDHWKIQQDAIQSLVKVRLEDGYGNYSHKALNKLLPWLKEGKNLSEAKNRAGYQEHEKEEFLNALPLPENLRNPVVMKALHEVRKVINAIIRTHGKPDIVRIEMARDLKQSKKDRDQYLKIVRAREKENEKISSLLREDPEFSLVKPTRDDRIKYQLWEECGMICPYSGQSISKTMLFGGGIEIEHIIPFSISLDDSIGNKTLCTTALNREKGNKTPYQAFGKQAEWADMLQRVRSSRMSFGKKKRFETKEVNFDNFSSRQLNDTRYICKEVSKYVKKLGVRVDVGRGQLTHAIRHQWGLNRLLSTENQKNRDDHRHHAIDALITAIISPKMMQEVSRISQRLHGASLSDRLFILPKPWATFDKDLKQKVFGIIVSHAEDNRISGAFHEDTAYGKRKDGTLSYRKSIEVLNIKECQDKIRDPAIKTIILNQISKYNGDIKKALAEPVFHKDGKTPIKKVRLETRKEDHSLFEVHQDGEPLKYHLLGNNHHLEVFEDNNGKWIPKIISTYEAAKRARIKKENIYSKDFKGNKFIMTLSSNQMLEISNETNVEYYRVQNISVSAGGRVLLKRHYSADIKDSSSTIDKTVNALKKLNFRKITIDPIGRVQSRND